MGSALLALAPVSSSMAVAAPRVGAHEGYTRLVFDLPSAAAQPKVTTKAGTATISVAVTLRPESGRVNSADVTSYAISSAQGGSQLQLSVTQGRSVKVFVLPEQGNQKARLVIDVGTGVPASAVDSGPASEGAAQTVRNVKSAQVPQATGAVQKVSTRDPGRPKLRIVLDAGHGGVDPGMVGYVVEKEVTLSVALKVRKLLEAHGVDVIMTRERDTHLSPDKLTDLGLRAQKANAGTVNAFVSIHVNAASPSAQGIETFVFGRPLEAHDRALAVRENGGGDLGEQLTREAGNLAENLLGDLLSQSNVTYSRKLANLVQKKMITATGAVDRGVRTNTFYVIRKPRTPALLIELGFGSHPTEGRKLATEEYRDRLATAIADGIAEFLHVK